MGLFDSMKEKSAQKKEAEAARQTADKARREQYKQKLMESDLVQNLLGTIEDARTDEDSSWIALATDYYDHDPREVKIDENGDGFEIVRAHYYTETEVVAVPDGRGGAYEKKIDVKKRAVVQSLGYGFTKSGYLPIDRGRKMKTDTGNEIVLKSKDIRDIVEEILYERLQQLFPKCDFKGRVKSILGSPEKPFEETSYQNLTYFVPSREYKNWY